VIRVRLRVLAALVALLWCAPSPAWAARPHRREAKAEVTVLAVVAGKPKEKVHQNGRTFEEMDIRVVDVLEGGGRIDVSREEPVHVAHDLTCGGTWVSLSKGDRVELRGEYIAVSGGRDVLHFTHPANGSCGAAGGHPDGYIRKR
jgi:hypothetical protein